MNSGAIPSIISAKDFKASPKRRNFDKSSHTDYHISYIYVAKVRRSLGYKLKYFPLEAI